MICKGLAGEIATRWAHLCAEKIPKIVWGVGVKDKMEHCKNWQFFTFNNPDNTPSNNPWDALGITPLDNTSGRITVTTPGNTPCDTLSITSDSSPGKTS